MRMTRFWRSLDQLLGLATCQYEWVRLIGEEWRAGAPLLKPAGRLAEAITCPNAGDLGCERQVVELIDGRLRAECGDIPRRCDHVELTRDEIVVLEVDRWKLVRAIGRALSLRGAPKSIDRGPVLSLGRYEVGAGRGFPVFLATPRPDFGPPFSALEELAGISGPKLLLTPTRRSLDQDVRQYLAAARVTLLALDDLLLWDGRNGLVPVQPVEELLAALVAEIAPASTAAGGLPAIDLPPGTRWQDLRLSFDAPETIILTVQDRTRFISPADLRMQRENSATPTIQWELLRQFAVHGGELPISSSAGSVQKQKQILSAKLRTAFGIYAEPIVAEHGRYRTLFAIDGDGLSQGRRGQSLRRA